MEEDKFFEYLDMKFESVGELLGSILDRLEEIKETVTIKGVVKQTLADFSKAPKAKTQYSKPMPEQIGGFNIAAKGCNRCGGKITWDNYDKINDKGFVQKYPDHVSKDGYLIECPEYKPE